MKNIKNTHKNSAAYNCIRLNTHEKYNKHSHTMWLPITVSQ